MDNFVGTTFVKLFMYNAYQGLFPFHSGVLPTNGKRKVCVGISLSDTMPPLCLRTSAKWRKKTFSKQRLSTSCRRTWGPSTSNP
jgi:hypothetical protein